VDVGITRILNNNENTRCKEGPGKQKKAKNLFCPSFLHLGFIIMKGPLHVGERNEEAVEGKEPAMEMGRIEGNDHPHWDVHTCWPTALPKSSRKNDHGPCSRFTKAKNWMRIFVLFTDTQYRG